MKRARIIKKFIAAGSCVLLCACSQEKGYDATGVFEATEVVVAAEGNGKISSFAVEEGRTLREGEAVGCIDTTQLHLKRLQLQARLQACRSRLRDVDRQLAPLRQQLATQRNERERFARLVDDQAANRKQLDDIDAQIALLEKQIAARAEELAQANDAARSECRETQALIDQTDDQIGKNVIRCPLHGRVLEKYAEAGELATAGRPLFKVADLENMHLRAYITGEQLTHVRLGQRVRVFADRGKDQYAGYDGTVTWIADQAEFTPKTIQTRDERSNLVYAIKIAVRNDGYIKNGMYGEVLLSTDGKD